MDQFIDDSEIDKKKWEQAVQAYKLDSLSDDGLCLEGNSFK